MQVQSLGQEDPLEKEMATHSSTLAWEIPWTEEPGRLQSTWGHKRVRQGLESKWQQKRFYLPFNWFRVHSACHRSAAGCGKSSAAWLSLLSSAFCMVSPPSHHLVNAINQNPIAENACISPTHLLLWQQFRHLSRCQAISVEINSIVFAVTVLSVLDLIHGKI